MITTETTTTMTTTMMMMIRGSRWTKKVKNKKEETSNRIPLQVHRIKKVVYVLHTEHRYSGCYSYNRSTKLNTFFVDNQWQLTFKDHIICLTVYLLLKAGFQNVQNISWVPDQNGTSGIFNMLEIYHSEHFPIQPLCQSISPQKLGCGFGCLWCFLPLHSLDGLLVKASASRAADPGFDSSLRPEDFSGSSHASDLKNWHSRDYPARRMHGVIGSGLGLVGPVSVYCGRVR